MDKTKVIRIGDLRDNRMQSQYTYILEWTSSFTSLGGVFDLIDNLYPYFNGINKVTDASINNELCELNIFGKITFVKSQMSYSPYHPLQNIY